MAKKDFSNMGLDALFSDTSQPAEKEGATKKAPEKGAAKGKKYFIKLAIEDDLVEFLDEIVWEERTNKTQYLNDLLRAAMEKHEE